MSRPPTTLLGNRKLVGVMMESMLDSLSTTMMETVPFKGPASPASLERVCHVNTLITPIPCSSKCLSFILLSISLKLRNIHCSPALILTAISSASQSQLRTETPIFSLIHGVFRRNPVPIHTQQSSTCLQDTSTVPLHQSSQIYASGPAASRTNHWTWTWIPWSRPMRLSTTLKITGRVSAQRSKEPRRQKTSLLPKDVPGRKHFLTSWFGLRLWVGIKRCLSQEVQNASAEKW